MPVGDYSELDEFRGPLAQPEAAGGRRVVQVNSSDVLISPTATELIAANPEFIIASGGGIFVNTSPIVNGTDKRLFFQDGTAMSQSANLTYNKVTDVFTTGAATTVVIPYVTSITADWAYGVIGDLDQFIGGFGTPTLGATNADADAYLNITEGESAGYTHKHPVMKGGVRVEQKDGTATYFEATADTDAARGVALQAALDAVKVLADAAGADGFSFMAPLTYVSADSAFYGVATFGGTSHTTKGGSFGTIIYSSYEGWTNGVVFKLTISPAVVFEVLYRFADTDVWNIHAALVPLTVGGTDYLYGFGGENASNFGKIWRIQKDGTDYAPVVALTSSTGFRPYGTPIVATDGNVYFTTSWSGDGTDNEYGTVCQFIPSSATLTNLFTFSTPATQGASPAGGLAQGANVGGQLAFYGTCQTGGTNNVGTLFRLLMTGASTGGVTALHSFNNSAGEGYYPIGDVLYDGGIIVGTCKEGGTEGHGTVFKYNLTGPVYTANFINASTTPTGFTGLTGVAPGMHPVAGLIKASNGAYYGTAMEGGYSNSGVVYKLTAATGAYTLIVECTEQLGTYPRCPLVEVSTNLFFPSQRGGLAGAGDICHTQLSFQTFPTLDYEALGASAKCAIYLSPGTFEIEPLRITYGDFSIVGGGMGNTTLKCKRDTWYKGITGGSWSFLSVWQSRHGLPRNIHLRNLTVDANVGEQTNEVNGFGVPTGAHTTGKVSFGGLYAFCSESSVENVRFINMGGFKDAGQQIYGCWLLTNGMGKSYYFRGVYSFGPAIGNRILNCDSQYPFAPSSGFMWGIRNGGDDPDNYTTPGNGWSINPLVDGCRVSDYTDFTGGSIYGFGGQATQGLVISNCSATNLGPTGGTIGFGLNTDNHSSRDTLITNLRVDGCYHGIRFAVDTTKPQTNVTIANCHIRAETAGISLNATTDGLRIMGNHITAPLGIDTVDTGSDGVAILNNLIDSSTTAIDTDAWSVPPKRFGNRTAAGTALAGDNKLELAGSTSGVVTIKTNATAGTWTLELPQNDGSSGEVLSTNGSGVTSWIPAGGAASLAVGTSPIASGTDGCIFFQDGASPTGVLQQQAGFTMIGGALSVPDNINAVGAISAASFSGDGSGLTDVLAATITVLDEPTDPTCFPLFVTAATGDLGPKTVSTLFTLNASIGALGIGTLDLLNSTVPANGMYLAGSNVVGFSANTLAKMRLTTAELTPASNDGIGLGVAGGAWSDLFLAEGGVINWDSGDATITQTGNDITVGGITTFQIGTSTAFTTGNIELNHASANTLSASSGVLSIKGHAIPTVDQAQTITAAYTFRVANAIRSEAASTQDAIVVAGRAGGTGSFAVTLTPATLAASVTATLPAVTGTVMVGATSTTTTQALFATATAGAPAFRALADTDLPTTISVATTYSSAAPQLTLGVVNATLGSIKMFGNTSGSITLSPAAVAGGTLTQTLPAISGVLGIKAVRILSFMVDGGGSAVTTGLAHGVAVCPVAGTITAWGIAVDTGTCTVKVNRKATGTAIPTTGDNITGTGIAIASGTYLRSGTVTEFDTPNTGAAQAVTANDIFSINVSTTSGPTWISVWVEVTPTN